MDQLIRQALARWGWSEDSACVLLAERENRVYRIEPLETGSNAALPIKSLVLRIHRQDYRSDAELNSELQWMSYLADCGMAVPKPIASTSGEYGEVVDGWQIDCLSLLDGVPLGSTGQALELEDRLGTFRRIGQTMARLHQLTDAWQLPDDFTRPHWNEAGLLGEQPLWGRFWENPKLTKDQAELLLAVRESALKTLDELGSKLDYGLIHADMVRENIFIKDNDIQLLDFDDSGFSFRLFEVATALFKNRDEADYAELEKALLEGYQEVQPLDTEHLALFTVLRACTYIGWIVPRLQEAGGEVRCQRFISTAIPLAAEHMKQTSGGCYVR